MFGSLSYPEREKKVSVVQVYRVPLSGDLRPRLGCRWDVTNVQAQNA